MAKLTDLKRSEIASKLAAGASVAQLSEQYKVSVPTIYNIRKNVKTGTTASDLVRQAIAKTDQEIAAIEKQIAEVESLRERLKAKKAYLDTLKKLEPGK